MNGNRSKRQAPPTRRSSMRGASQRTRQATISDQAWERTMRLNIGVSILFLSWLSLGSTQAQTTPEIVGCWRLQSLVADRAGEKSEPFGPNPIGQYLNTGDGHVSV